MVVLRHHLTLLVHIALRLSSIHGSRQEEHVELYFHSHRRKNLFASWSATRALKMPSK